MNLPPPHLPSSITLSPTPCSPPCSPLSVSEWTYCCCVCVVSWWAQSALLSSSLAYLLTDRKNLVYFPVIQKLLKKSIEKMFCKEQLNIYILHFHEDCGGLNSSIYMVNFLNYFPKANVFLKASLIDCWL